MKRVHKIIVIAALVIIAVGIGTVVYTKTRTSNDQVFRNYLLRTAKQTTYSSSESYSGTGTTATLKGIVDISAKKLTVSGELTCTVNIESKPVVLKASFQTENADLYMKINDTSGEVKNLDSGETYNLANVYSKVRGVWYKLDPDSAIKSQLDSGIYVSSTGIIAPSYDTDKLVNALLAKKAIVYSYESKTNDGYVFRVTAHKDAYLETLKEVFPNLSNPDLVLDQVFTDGSTLNSTITVDKDGTVKSEKLTDTNPCTNLVNNLIGEQYEGLAKSLTGTSTPQPKDSISIQPIQNPKPIAELQNDMVL